MHRREVVQTILNKFGGKTYLEIGLAKGDSFFSINAKTKMGVDTRISKCAKIGQKNRPIYSRLPLSLKREKLFEMTSDMFFSKHSKILSKHKIDVALIDGLHTYQQALGDAINCLNHLSPKGFVVMHDCNPPSETMAYPASSFEEAKKLNLPGWEGLWCGDVWKAIVYLRSQRSDLRIFVLECDWGVGVICKGEPENTLSYPAQDIERMSYQDLHLNREKFLNLKAPTYLNDFLKEL